ncbi:phage portal protein [Pseudomonas resinovorans]|uniref:Phage portal protein n=1 Tax=Metapseudomonas resinovorans TaxID=53412 RepID=A0ABT4Y8R7_METRE|nr:phage portal protein [Pseudomonas resinovorans]MDA8485156.1 phage portal protein [Pseudomonas resinovorans]
MRLFGFEINWPVRKSLSPVDNRGGWLPLVREPFSGAWQRNMEVSNDTLRAFFAIYSCITLVAGDISKLRPKLVRLDDNGIWIETTSAAFSPVLRRPNRYQNRIQFLQWWLISKLANGNTYVLKQRDSRGVVVALYVLDPARVEVLVAEDGSVYYQLNQDELNNLQQAIVVPASEIIHDRYSPQFHPLVGISPIFAAALAGALGMRIQQDSQQFFSNGAKPGGILSAPGAISDETAARLKAHWDQNYTGTNAGKVAVVGDGLKFEAMRATSVDSQLVEQLRLSAEVVCSCFHVPSFKIGFGTLPNGKVENMNQIYYTDCLQALIEELELCLDDGLGLGISGDTKSLGIELDLDGLLRMDMGSQVTMLREAVNGKLMTTNEGRKRLNLPPVAGGDVVTAQQQDFSLEALAERDASDPFSKPEPAPASVEPAEASDEEVQDQARMLALLLEKELTSAEHA